MFGWGIDVCTQIITGWLNDITWVTDIGPSPVRLGSIHDGGAGVARGGAGEQSLGGGWICLAHRDLQSQGKSLEKYAHMHRGQRPRCNAWSLTAYPGFWHISVAQWVIWDQSQYIFWQYIFSSSLRVRSLSASVSLHIQVMKIPSRTLYGEECNSSEEEC